MNAIPPDSIDQLFSRWDNDHSPGATVAVSVDGKIIFSNSYGMANLEYDMSIRNTTQFHAASLAKQFTAFSIALLEEQDTLSFQDDIRSYLPEMPDFGQSITIDHLLHHTSGLRDQWDLLQLAGWRPDDVITEEDILRLVYQQKELNFAPGEEFQYSNTNYTLLARIVEAVTGEAFST